MADIQTDLNTIANGKYGKDVRKAIHDAIETCYSDGRVGSVDLTARKQIAQLVTSGNKELTEQTLWSGSIYGTGASASLASAITNFDYLDLYVTKEGNVSIHTIPASRGTYIIRESNLPDDGAASFSISEAGVTFTDNSTISLYKEMYFSYENGTATGRIVNPTDTDSQSLLHLVKVIGRKSVANTEVVDLRTPAEGMDVPEGGYSTAGDAVRGQISELKSQIAQSTGMSNDFKVALENLLTYVVYKGDDPTGRTYLTALHNAMYPPAQLTSITAVYTQSGTVYNTDSLDDLKSDLVVTANYDDETSETVTTYTLSGTLTEGTSVITVSYGEMTTTFNVTVTVRRVSGDDVWYDGVAYEDLTIVANEYVKYDNGNFVAYNGWSRTGFVYCEGATSITFPPMPESGSGVPKSTAFYSNNSTSTRINAFQLSKTASTTVTVPSNAKYFAISSNTSALNSCIEAGIVPNA